MSTNKLIELITTRRVELAAARPDWSVVTIDVRTHTRNKATPTETAVMPERIGWLERLRRTSLNTWGS
jgi:hypothetical protein